MSRRRRFNGNDLEFSDCDSRSNSFTDDEQICGASPNTMALYLYDERKAGQSRDISNFINFEPKLEITEDCFPDQDDDIFQMDSMKSEMQEIKNNFKTVKVNDASQNIFQSTQSKKDISKPSLDIVKEIKNTTSIVEKPSKRVKQKKVETIPYDPTDALKSYEELRGSDRERPLINLISIGHVDAGKSTLMGNLLCQMNYVSNKKIAKYKHDAQKVGKSSFAYAWVLDESQEERVRGITTDVAETYFETNGRRIQLLDAPGHRDFIPNMIGGASQADAAILVVNATRGEFETGFESGGQTQEHTYLVRVLGVSSIIVAVNKMDKVDWEKARFDEIRNKISRFLKPLKLSAVFCPVSGLLGTNVVSAPEPGVMDWYGKGPTLVDLINQIEPPTRSVDRPVRIAVNDVYKPPASSNLVVAGRMESGWVTNGTRLLCLPSGSTYLTVKSIRMNSGKAVDEAGTIGEVTVTSAFDGDHVVLIPVPSNVDYSQCLELGSFLCHPDYPMPCSNRIQARLLIFGLKYDQSITRNFCVTFYYQNLSIPARFEKFHSVSEKMGITTNKGGDSGAVNKMSNGAMRREVEKKNPRVISGSRGSCTALVDLCLDKTVCIESYEAYRNIGKFTLRDCGVTIAGGTVVKVLKSR